MPFFTKSRKPSQQVTIVKAVNGGSRGHRERSRKQQSHPPPRQQQFTLAQPLSQPHGFWDAIDEHDFAQQDPIASPNLDKMDNFRRRKRQYSTETPQSRSRQSSNDDVSPQQDFWRKPTEHEEAELAQTASPATTVTPQRQKRTGFFSRRRQTV